MARTRTDDRLLLDQDCLQWTPPVHSDDDDDDDIETDDAFAVQVAESLIFYATVRC